DGPRAGRSAEARRHADPGIGSGGGSAKSIRRLPRFDARRDFWAEPVTRLVTWFGAQRACARDRRRRTSGLEYRAGAAAGPASRTIWPAGLWAALRRRAATAICVRRRRLVPRDGGGCR